MQDRVGLSLLRRASRNGHHDIMQLLWIAGLCIIVHCDFEPDM